VILGDNVLGGGGSTGVPNAGALVPAFVHTEVVSVIGMLAGAVLCEAQPAMSKVTVSVRVRTVPTVQAEMADGSFFVAIITGFWNDLFELSDPLIFQKQKCASNRSSC
jgi:hypothetical protein